MSKPSGWRKGSVITFYDVTALFTSGFFGPCHLHKSSIRCVRTHNYITGPPCPYITHHIAGIRLKILFFLFQGEYYEQVQGTALGSPDSSIVTNLFMEEFEIKAATLPANPKVIFMYVEDTVTQKAEHSHQFLKHINSIDPHIQFTAGTPNTDGSTSFWTFSFAWILTTHF